MLFFQVLPVSFLDAFAKFLKATISFVLSVVSLSVRPSAWNNSAPTRRIFMKLIFEYFSKISRKYKFDVKI